MNNTSHDELIQNYLENEATPAEERQFRILLGEKSFRRRVAEYAIDHGHLCDHARQGLLDKSFARAPLHRKRWRVLASMAVAASLLLAATAWLATRSDETPGALTDRKTVPVTEKPSVVSPDKRAIVARVAGVTGKVLTAPSLSSPNRRAVGKNAVFRSGDVLETVGPASYVLLKFDDGSVVSVAGETELTTSVTDSQKQLFVHRGNIMAHVASQPAGKPMLIDTAVAQAEVLGTDLSLFANLVLTELAVLEGHVLMRRLSDKQVVYVQDGESVIASANSDFVTKTIAPVSGRWEEDFEQGLSDKWEVGKWIQDAGPPGSHGAVQAAVPKADQDNPDSQYFVASPRDWWRGLFLVEKDTHLNFTYKLSRMGWFNVMIETRSDKSGGTYTGTFLYKNVDMWNRDPNQWRTVSVPLEHFRVPPGAKIERGPPEAGHAVYRFYFSTSETDPGLIIDRIWTSRGVPESIEILGPWK